jgi:hypothetical protein
MSNPAERLCKFVMREYGAGLTAKQIRSPWTPIGTQRGEITGVIVPADGDSPSLRVMLVEIEGKFSGFTSNAPPALELA